MFHRLIVIEFFKSPGDDETQSIIFLFAFVQCL